MKGIKYFTSAITPLLMATRVRNFLMDEDYSQSSKIERLIDLLGEISEGTVKVDSPCMEELVVMLSRNIIEARNPDSRWNKSQRIEMGELSLRLCAVIDSFPTNEVELKINPYAAPYKVESGFHWELLSEKCVPIDNLLPRSEDQMKLRDAIDTIEAFRLNLLEAGKLEYE